MKNIGPGCASTGARMCEYRYPDVRVQVPGCASTGTRMWEYRYPGCGSTGPDGSNIFSGIAPIGGILVPEKN